MYISFNTPMGRLSIKYMLLYSFQETVRSSLNDIYGAVTGGFRRHRYLVWTILNLSQSTRQEHQVDLVLRNESPEEIPFNRGICGHLTSFATILDTEVLCLGILQAQKTQCNFKSKSNFEAPSLLFTIQTYIMQRCKSSVLLSRHIISSSAAIPYLAPHTPSPLDTRVP